MDGDARETLFPAFETQTGNAMGPTRVMRMEHLFVLTSAVAEFVYPAGAALGLSGLLLTRNLFTAVARFSRHGGRFN